MCSWCSTEEVSSCSFRERSYPPKFPGVVALAVNTTPSEARSIWTAVRMQNAK